MGFTEIEVTHTFKLCQKFFKKRIAHWQRLGTVNCFENSEWGGHSGHFLTKFGSGGTQWALFDKSGEWGDTVGTF